MKICETIKKKKETRTNCNAGYPYFPVKSSVRDTLSQSSIVWSRYASGNKHTTQLLPCWLLYLLVPILLLGLAHLCPLQVNAAVSY